MEESPISSIKIRTCVACRRRKEQAALLRFSRALDGALTPWTGTGRSGYVCHDEACLEGLAKKGVLERALRTPVRPEERSALCQTLTCRLR